MVRCFYCMSEDHTISDCELKQNTGLDRDRKRRTRKWGYTPIGELLTALNQHSFVPRHYSWLIYFFRPLHVDKLIKAEAKSGLLVGVSDIYSNPEFIEAEQLFKMGYEKFKEGLYQPAVVIMKLILEKNADDYRAAIIKGYAQIEQMQPEKAIASFEAAARIAPSDYYRSGAFLFMARVHQSVGETERAIILAQKAMSSKLTEAGYLLSLLYVEKGLVRDGLAQLQSVIERDRDYLIACCYEPGFLKIDIELNFFLENMLKECKENIDHKLERLQVTFQEAKNLEVKQYDPMDYKNARFKYFVAEKKHATQGYFSFIDADRLANEANAYLKTAKFSAVARKKLALGKLQEYVSMRLNSGLAAGAFAAGWGLVAGGGLGIAMVMAYGPEHHYKIYSYAIKGAAIFFLWTVLLNWRVTHYKKRFFLKGYAKRFQKESGTPKDKQIKSR